MITRMKRRRFSTEGCLHIYQKPIHGIVLFHTVRDYLMFHTIVSVVASRHKVQVLCVCPMPDHIHIILIAETKEEMAAFVQEYTSIFVKEYNKSLGRDRGHIFTVRYGCAPKRNEKDIRSCLAYGYNNPVERGLCRSAEEYKWNLLQFWGTKRDPKLLSTAEMKIIRMHRRGKWLGYDDLETLFDKLDDQQSNSLCDFILREYFITDIAAAVSYYGSFDSMLKAFRYNTGAERELKESWIGYTDSVYSKMGSLIEQKYSVGIKDVLRNTQAERTAVYNWLSSLNQFNPKQIRKYLQLPPD